MRFAKLVIILGMAMTMGSGCLMVKCIDMISDLGPEKTLKMSAGQAMEGGLLKDNESIVLSFKEEQYLLEKKEGNIYAVSREKELEVDTPLPVYALNEKPGDKEEFINIKRRSGRYLYMDLKRHGSPPIEIKIDCFTNSDPMFIKRTGLVMLIPVAVAADLVVVTVLIATLPITIFFEDLGFPLL